MIATNVDDNERTLRVARQHKVGMRATSTTTPLWVPILIAGLGLLATIAGVLITQLRSDRREQHNWTREREREHERWEREDSGRTFEHRREAYSQFYESLREMAFVAYNHGMGLNESEELENDWQLSTFRRLQHLQLYGSKRVYEAANTAYSAAWNWGNKAKFGKDDHDFYNSEERYNETEVALLSAIRRDLSIPDQ